MPFYYIFMDRAVDLKSHLNLSGHHSHPKHVTHAIRLGYLANIQDLRALSFPWYLAGFDFIHLYDS